MDSIIEFLKCVLQRDNVRIDNFVCRLHSQVSLLFMIGCSALVIFRQTLWEEFTCEFLPNLSSLHMPNSYCAFNATFDFPDPSEQRETTDEDMTLTSYEWIGIILGFQSALFYVPMRIWKALEGGKVKDIVSGLDDPKLEDSIKRTKINVIVDYISRNLHGHDNYLYYFIACEVLNFFNAFGQVIFLNEFFGKQYDIYGPNEIQFLNIDRATPQNSTLSIFPETMICHYSPSEDENDNDVMIETISCESPLNIINGNLYYVIWIWLIILTVLSAIRLLYWAVFIQSSRFRFRELRRDMRLTEESIVMTVTEGCQLGDWFLFDLLARNMDAATFHDLIMEFANRCKDRKSKLRSYKAGKEIETESGLNHHVQEVSEMIKETTV